MALAIEPVHHLAPIDPKQATVEQLQQFTQHARVLIEHAETQDELDTLDALLVAVERRFKQLRMESDEVSRTRALLMVRLGELLKAEPERRGRPDKTLPRESISRADQNRRYQARLLSENREVVDELLAEEKPKALKHIVRACLARRIHKEPAPLPQGPFRVIVADPPWRYTKREEDSTHRAGLPYPAMSIEDIAAMQVEGLAHEDAVLWLWTTNAHMEHAFDIVRAWGFEPKTILTWAKDRMGTGDWLRGQTEHCLLGVRGKPVVVLTNQTTLLHGPLREHSQKPEEFYELVEDLCPAGDGGRLELFARQARPGWQAWGAEAPE